MPRPRIVAAVIDLMASLFLAVRAASAPKSYPTCKLPESGADPLVILNAIYPNRYIWDDADITLHYVPYAGGTVFAGYAICGAAGCPPLGRPPACPAAPTTVVTGVRRRRSRHSRGWR
jgi:hypothetical protein